MNFDENSSRKNNFQKKSRGGPETVLPGMALKNRRTEKNREGCIPKGNRSSRRGAQQRAAQPPQQGKQTAYRGKYRISRGSLMTVRTVLLRNIPGGCVEASVPCE